jgi:hypothetical protein
MDDFNKDLLKFEEHQQSNEFINAPRTYPDFLTLYPSTDKNTWPFWNSNRQYRF